MTDIILSEFVNETGLEPAVAQDILLSHSWDPQEALKAVTTLKTARLREGIKQTSPSLPSPKRFPDQPAGRVDSAGNIIIPVGRPILQKNDAVEISEDTAGRKWSRGISRASENLALVTRARSEVAKGFTLDDPACVPNHTFTLPDLTVIQPEDFRAFVENDLIETATLVSLEQAGRLNWWADTKPCQRLLPLATTGDGNCLLHAASLGIWGFHDRLLTLRKSLNHILSRSEYEAAIYRRWRWHQTILNKQSGLTYTESEWDKEWFNILKLSSTEPRSRVHNYICCENSPKKNGLAVVEEKESETTGPASCHDSTDDNTQYESLEEVHVFALAYAIKRPIIVIAEVYLRDSAGEPLAPIPFGGIYLPLGCDPKNCRRSPLVLAYDAAHFSALVPMKRDTPTADADLPAVIPVTDSQGQLLPILFLVDPGESFQWGHEDNDPQVIHRLTNISAAEKLHVLLTYLDLVKVTAVGKGKDSVSSNAGVDDRRSTADSNESESSSGGRSDVSKGKTGIGKHMKSVKQKLKRSISKLTRRTSEENDVGVVKGAQEKNAVAQQLQQKVNGVVEEKEKVGSVETIGENGSCRWKMETVKDVPEGGMLNASSAVLGSLLSCDEETSFHSEMISNYLTAARARFAQHLKDRERRDNLQLPNGSLRCANIGCDNLGSLANNYLCAGCYNRQKTQVEEMRAQRETTTIGKSTFYASNAKEELPVLNNLKTVRGNSTPQLPRPNPMEISSARFRPVEEDCEVRRCATENCPFFGREKNEWLCSQCYRSKNVALR